MSRSGVLPLVVLSIVAQLFFESSKFATDGILRQPPITVDPPLQTSRVVDDGISFSGSTSCPPRLFATPVIYQVLIVFEERLRWPSSAWSRRWLMREILEKISIGLRPSLERNRGKSHPWSFRILHWKNDFVEAKNLIRYRSETNFVGSSKWLHREKKIIAITVI